MALKGLQAFNSGMTNNFILNSVNPQSLAPAPVQEQQFCLRWNNYHSNLSTVFDQLFQSESFVDVSLVTEGRTIKAHKMVLAASSPYFQTILSETPCEHPIIIVKDVKWEELQALVDFMYRGEINVGQEQIRPLLKLAEMFQIRGLTDVNPDAGDEPMPVDNNSIEQFTIYTAENCEVPAVPETNVCEGLYIKKEIPKVRDLARKQNLETLDAPVEWLNEEDAALRPKSRNSLKRSYSSSADVTSDDSSLANFDLKREHSPPSSVLQPTPIVPVPANYTLQPSVNFKTCEDVEQQTQFLDTTNGLDGDNSLNNSHNAWNSSTGPTGGGGHGKKASRPSAESHLPCLPSEARGKQKAPAWNWNQLQEAIVAVVTQRLRFTQASARYNIPKGTLYDNILGKAHRMAVLNELALSPTEEAAVLEFCCDTSNSPYNKRTKKSLRSILQFLSRFESFRAKGDRFKFGGKNGFRWWWAFCRKHSIVSLYYEGMKLSEKEPEAKNLAKRSRKSAEYDEGPSP